jgi:mono/diheme cytochrome c family protein
MKSTLLAGIAASLVLLGGPKAALAADAPTIWAKDCASCHGRDGAGKTKAGHLSGAKDLTDAQYQKTFTDDVAFNDTKGGLVKDGKTKMKPFQDKLSDDEITALVAYVRGFVK